MWLLASFITKAWIPQQINTTAASTIQSQPWALPSVSLGIAKQMIATNASTIPRIPNFDTFSLRMVADSSTVTMGATEIMGITR